MNFQDSFFESSSSSGEDEEKASVSHSRKTPYRAKICEPQWFMDAPESPAPVTGADSIHSIGFMVMKHKADLLYHHQQHKEAACLYGTLLARVPETNTCVSREVRDGLARSYLKLGEGELAYQTAERLVAPPNDKDWTSWQLLADCHTLLEDHEAQVLTLQTSASLQRCHAHFWTSLSRGYRNLSEVTAIARSCRQCLHQCLHQCHHKDTQEVMVTGSCHQCHHKDTQEVMVTGSCHQCHHNDTQEDMVTGPCHQWSCHQCHHVSSQDILGDILVQMVQLFRPYFTWRMETKVGGETRREAADGAECQDNSEECRGGNGGDGGGGGDGVDHSNPCSASSKCAELCIFSNVPVSEDPSLYVPTLLRQDHTHPARPPWCYCHSPFVMLIRHVVSPDKFVAMTDSLHSKSHSDIAHQLLTSICDMAECSCLVWVRKLLLYSVRHSHSFPKEALQAQLEEVEQMLDSCHSSDLKTYILAHFTRRTVFEENEARAQTVV